MAAKPKRLTVRNVSSSLDLPLRRRAASEKVSLDTVLLRALETEAGRKVPEHDELDAFFGSWIADWRVDRAIADVRRGRRQ